MSACPFGREPCGNCTCWQQRDPVRLEARATILEAEGRALIESRPLPGTKAELDAHLKIEAAARLRDRAAELRGRSATC